jgi:phosphatidylinositol glycan class C protein
LSKLIIRKSLPLTSYLSFVSIYISIFRGLLKRNTTSSEILTYCFVVAIAVLFLRRLLFSHSTTTSSSSTPSTSKPIITPTVSATFLLPPLVLYLLSPLLLSLTKATTSDTIWPLAGGLFLVGGLLGGFGVEVAEPFDSDVHDDGGRKDGKVVRGREGKQRRASVVGTRPAQDVQVRSSTKR